MDLCFVVLIVFSTINADNTVKMIDIQIAHIKNDICILCRYCPERQTLIKRHSSGTQDNLVVVTVDCLCARHFCAVSVCYCLCRINCIIIGKIYILMGYWRLLINSELS